MPAFVISNHFLFKDNRRQEGITDGLVDWGFSALLFISVKYWVCIGVTCYLKKIRNHYAKP